MALAVAVDVKWPKPVPFTVTTVEATLWR